MRYSDYNIYANIYKIKIKYIIILPDSLSYDISSVHRFSATDNARNATTGNPPQKKMLSRLFIFKSVKIE